MPGLDPGVGDRAVRRDGEVHNDGAADMHAARELRIDRPNLADDGAMSVGSMSETCTHTERHEKEKVNR